MVFSNSMFISNRPIARERSFAKIDSVHTFAQSVTNKGWDIFFAIYKFGKPCVKLTYSIIGNQCCQKWKFVRTRSTPSPISDETWRRNICGFAFISSTFRCCGILLEHWKIFDWIVDIHLPRLVIFY